MTTISETWNEAYATQRSKSRELYGQMIYDEVVTGFRYSPGGYQALAGVKPDLTVLGKIISGGMPGAAVVGSPPRSTPTKTSAAPSPPSRKPSTHCSPKTSSPTSATAAVLECKR